MEKLLQKNYFLHQSARDGYRAYLQSYASYSLKKIFDVNALDLVKVGKAFGFSVPPRVNVTVGGGIGGTGKSGKKRIRDEGGDDDSEWSDEEGNMDGDGADDGRARSNGRRQGKARRIETFGKKMVEKEVYKKNVERRNSSGAQWSR